MYDSCIETINITNLYKFMHLFFHNSSNSTIFLLIIVFKNFDSILNLNYSVIPA